MLNSKIKGRWLKWNLARKNKNVYRMQHAIAREKKEKEYICRKKCLWKENKNIWHWKRMGMKMINNRMDIAINNEKWGEKEATWNQNQESKKIKKKKKEKYGKRKEK